MTKMVEHLNKDDPDTSQNEAANESEDYDGIGDNCSMHVNIHHLLCAVLTLQLVRDGLKLPHCAKLLIKTNHIVSKLRFPNTL